MVLEIYKWARVSSISFSPFPMDTVNYMGRIFSFFAVPRVQHCAREKVCEMLNRAVLFWLAGLTISFLQLVSASEEHRHHGGHEGGHSEYSTPPAPGSLDTLPYYFALPDHKGLLYGHIALMSIGWLIILPIGEAFIVLLPITIILFS